MIALTTCAVLVAATAGIDEEQHLNDRQSIVSEFDADGDGRLNAAEREVLRRSVKDGSRRRRFSPERRQKFEPVTIAKFDADMDGKLNDQEYQAAQAGIRKQWDELVRRFAAFKDDQLIIENLNRMESEAKAGSIEDFPPELFGWIEFVRNRARGENQERPAHILAQFDSDGNGRLNHAELAEARAAVSRILKQRPLKPQHASEPE